MVPGRLRGRLHWLSGLRLFAALVNGRNRLSAYGARKIPSLGTRRHRGYARGKRRLDGVQRHGLVSEIDGERASKVAADDVFAGQRASGRAGRLVRR
jgi:hypothetical protein